MSKQAYFRESEYYTRNPCDKCGQIIASRGTGKTWWNPNRKARDKNICSICHEVIVLARTERKLKWLSRGEAIKSVFEVAGVTP